MEWIDCVMSVLGVVFTAALVLAALALAAEIDYWLSEREKK